MRRPPGVSIARAKSVRARDRKSGVRPSRSSPNSSSCARNDALSNIAHSPNRLNRRFCISLAAALVKVRHRICSGRVSPSSSRATRSVRTRVLPDPALALSHVEAVGSAARTCASVASLRIMSGAPWLQGRTPSIPRSATADHNPMRMHPCACGFARCSQYPGGGRRRSATLASP